MPTTWCCAGSLMRLAEPPRSTVVPPHLTELRGLGATLLGVARAA